MHEPRRLAFGRRIETITAITALAVLAAGVVLVLRPFFSALLWAIILTYTTWPAYAWLEVRLRHRPSLAAVIMTVCLALAFILPLSLVATTITKAAGVFADDLHRLMLHGPPQPPAWIERLPLFGPDLLDTWRELASDTTEFAAFIRPYLANARAYALGTGLAVGGGIVDLSLSVFTAFFLYRNGIGVVNRIRTVGERVVGDHVHHLLLVTATTIRGVVYGTIGGALVQGALAALGFWLAGVPGFLFLGSLTFLFGLVPGAPPLIWIAVTIWLVAVDQIGPAVFMGLWGLLVITGLESFIKPYLISRESQIPLLIVFLGVIGGALAFGFIGVFLGPTLLGVAYALLVDWSAKSEKRPTLRSAEKAGMAGGRFDGPGPLA